LSEHVSMLSFFALHFNAGSIQVLKYVGDTCKFGNPTIIFKIFVQSTDDGCSDFMWTDLFHAGARRVLRQLCPAKSND